VFAAMPKPRARIITMANAGLRRRDRKVDCMSQIRWLK
jgi:hypothetical protein